MSRSRDAGRDWSGLLSQVGRQTDRLRLMDPRGARAHKKPPGTWVPGGWVIFQITCPNRRPWLPEGAVNGDEHKADQRHHKSDAHRMHVGDVAHERGRNRPAHDGHHDQRRPQLGVIAQSANAQRENGGEHDGHEEECAEQGVHAHLAAAHDHGGERHVDDRISAQNEVGFGHADHRAAAEASGGKQHKPDGAQPVSGLQFRHGGVIFQDVIDKEAENARLGRHIKKLRGDAQREMFAPEQIPILGDQQEGRHIRDHEQSEFGRLEQGVGQGKQGPQQAQDRGDEEIQHTTHDHQRDGDGRGLPAGGFKAVDGTGGVGSGGFPIFILGAQIWHGAKNENDQQQGHKNADAQVGRGQARVGVRPGAAAEHELSADDRTEDPAPAVDRLGDIDARRAAFRRPEHRGVGVGDGFQAGHARGDHKQAQQKRPVGANADGRNEPKRAGGNQRQAHQNPALVTEFARNHAGGNRHEKIRQIIGELHQPRLLLVNVQRFLKMLVKDVNHPIAEAPQQEQ